MRLAICSTNRRKYSETFIHAHFELLNENGLLLCDGYLPTSFSADRGERFQSIIRKNVVGIALKSYDAKTNLTWLLEKYRIDIVLAEYGPAGVEMMSICKDLGIPLVVHFYGYDAFRNDILNSYGLGYRELFVQSERINVVSIDMMRQLEKLGCPSDKVHVQRCGIDTDLFAPPRNKKQNFQFVFCGRFVAKKAPDQVIRAFSLIHAQNSAARLTMIGDGELWNDSKALVASLGLKDYVKFTGVLPPDELATELAKASIFLQHSILTKDNDSEGMPVSVLSAMASGLAVVGTKHGGIAEIIRHGETGLLVNEGDHKGMANEALGLLSNPELCIKLGRAARIHVVKHHEKVQCLDSLRCILNEIAL